MDARPGGTIRLRLLGRFAVFVDGSPVDDARWPRRKARQLIQLLALSDRRRLHQEQVMEALWPEVPPSSAANSLNKAIHMARRALEPDLPSGSRSRFLTRGSGQVTLRVAADAIDVVEFERLAAAASKDGGLGAFEAGLELYGGDLLPGDLYEDWLQDRRERLQDLYNGLLLGLAELHGREGRDTAAIEPLNALLAREPANERAHRLLMQSHARLGQRDAALRQFARLRDALAEFEAAPDAATTELHDEIVAGRMAPVAAPPAVAPAADAPVASLAVLPLINATHQDNLDYLCEGVSESVIHRLSQVPGLRVMALATVLRLDRAQDPLEAGRRLGVEAAFVGRVEQFSDRLNVRAELVRVADGSLMWGERYVREPGDILELQQQLAGELSEQLRPHLTGDERRRVGKRYTGSTRAYHAYLKGRHAWNRRTAEGLRQGLHYFQQAIDADPTYALAYSGLADCHNLLSLYGGVAPRDSMRRARFAAERALEIDAALAQAHTSLAYCQLYYDWDWEGAERSFRRSLELNPNYATAHHWYHEYLTAMGRFDEQAAEIRRAEDLDPLSLIIKTEFGWGLYYARDYERAVSHLEETLDRDPGFVPAHFVLGLTYLQQGEFEAAVDEIQRAIELSRDAPFVLAVGALGHALARAGKPDAARRELRRLQDLSTQGFVSAYCPALVHAGLGENDRALELLGEALAERYNRLIFLRVEPLADGLRDEPGFRRLLGEVGFEQE